MFHPAVPEIFYGTQKIIQCGICVLDVSQVKTSRERPVNIIEYDQPVEYPGVLRDLYDVITVVGTGKGRECPGHSIMPNLFMYEVAKREGLADTDRFLEAARN